MVARPMAALALNGHAIRFAGCLLWGVKQTWPENAATMSGTATVSAPEFEILSAGFTR